jgi:hypothetical protein
VPPRSLDEIDQELKTVQLEIMQLLEQATAWWVCLWMHSQCWKIVTESPSYWIRYCL